MPQATTTVAQIKAKVQNRVADFSENTWDADDWIQFFNDCTYEILNDIIAEHADHALADALQAVTTITLVADTESYDYYTAITNDSKTFYKFLKATWGTNIPHPVRVYPWDRYEDLKIGRVVPSTGRPFMSFFGHKYFYLQPIPSGNDEAFKFYYIQKPTDVTDTSGTSSLDERVQQLYESKLADKYWQRRRRYDLSRMEKAEYMKDVRTIILPYKKYPIVDVVSADGE